MMGRGLGLSTLVLAQNDRKPAGCTETAAFHAPSAQPVLHLNPGADLSAGAAPPKGYVRGAVLDTRGNAIPHATLEVQPGCTHATRHIERALLQADEQGRYHFCTSLPDNPRILPDGPAGQLLAALNRPDRRPAHLEFTVQARGYQRLTTQVFRQDDPCLDSDPLFGVRSSLITQWQRHPGGMTPAGTFSNEPFYTLAFDFVLANE